MTSPLDPTDPLTPLATDQPQWSGFLAALAGNGLPTADLADGGAVYYALLQDGAAAGYGGFALYGRMALLRSLLVLPPHRGSGVGGSIVSGLLDQLRRRQVDRVWLLTDSAPFFFARFGFVAQQREAAPAAIAATRQFSGLCSPSAVLMCLNMN